MEDLSPEDLSMIDQISATQMGVLPQTPPPQQAPQQVPQQAPQQAAPKQTPNEEVSQSAAPATEGTTQKADPFEFFEIDLGDGKKQALSPAQIKGMATRYKDLNYRHATEIAPVKKSIGLLNSIRQQAEADGNPLTDDALAEVLEAALSAYAHNPTMGKQGDPNKAPSNPNRTDTPVQKPEASQNPNDLEDQLMRWEQENAVSLPPMFKDMLNKTGTLETKISELTDMIKNMATEGKQIADGAIGAVDEARKMHADAGMRQIMNNLQQVQMKHQLPDEAEKDFMTFVQERGYVLEDLFDAQLADKLGGDFKAVMQSPEIERLRKIAERRQAFTGTLSPSPSGTNPSAPNTPDPDAEFIGQVADTHMRNRNMM